MDNNTGNLTISTIIVLFLLLDDDITFSALFVHIQSGVFTNIVPTQHFGVCCGCTEPSEI